MEIVRFLGVRIDREKVSDTRIIVCSGIVPLQATLGSARNTGSSIFALRRLGIVHFPKANNRSGESYRHTAAGKVEEFIPDTRTEGSRNRLLPGELGRRREGFAGGRQQEVVLETQEWCCLELFHFPQLFGSKSTSLGAQEIGILHYSV